MPEYRARHDNGGDLRPMLVSDKAAYSPGEAVVVTWTGLPGNATDWVSVAPSGSSLTTATRWTYVGGLADGSVTFNGLTTTGNFVARAYSNDSYDLVVESTRFTIGSSGGVTTDSTTYTPAQGIVVSWTGLPGNLHDWIALAPESAGAQTALAWVYTNGVASVETRS